MPQPIMEWESRMGRRFRLRDLYILSTVVQRGSMARAALQLRMSQPSISEAIAKLEDTLRIRLLDRGPRGIEPTIYATALLKRGTVVFDELREAIKEVDFLADPAKGEVRVGCPETLAGVVSSMIDRMSRRHPQITVQVVPTEPAMMQLSGLRDRSVDLLLGRLVRPKVDNDIETESLFEERYVVVAGSKNPWAGRRKINLSKLVNEPWVLLPQSHFLMPRFLQAFLAKGVDAPRATVTTVSLHVRNHLLSTGRFIGLMSSSALRLDGRRWGIKELPVDLTVEVPPVSILTLKKRTLGPAAQLFIKYAKAMGTPDGRSHRG
jgi:DNA-binding transcriptional LysR family regulator